MYAVGMAHTTTTPISTIRPGDVIVRDQFGDADRTGYVMGVHVGDSGVMVDFSTARSNGSYYETFEISEDVEAIWGD